MADENKKMPKIDFGGIASTALGAFSTIAPFSTNTANSIAESIRDMKDINRKSASGLNIQQRAINNTKGNKDADKLLRGAMNDMAQGSFKIGKTADDLYTKYNDNIATDFDNVSDPEVGLSSDQISVESNKAVAKTIVESNAATIDAISESTRANINTAIKIGQSNSIKMQNNIMLMTNTLNTSLTITNHRLESIDRNIQNMLEFQNKNMNTYFETSIELLSGLGKVIENTNMHNKKTDKSSSAIFEKGSGFNMGNYVKLVKDNLEKSVIGSIMGMGKVIEDSGGGVGAVAKATLNSTLSPLVENFLNKSLQNTISLVDKRMSAYGEEALKTIGDSTSKNPILQMLGLGEIFGIKRTKIQGINMGMYNKDSMTWNGVAQKALVEVIPELLTSIDNRLGGEKRYMDYDTGVFKTKKEIEREFSSLYQNSVQGTFDKKIEDLISLLESNGAGNKNDIIDLVERMVNSRLQDKLSNKDYNEGMIELLRSSNINANTTKNIILGFEDSIESVKQQISNLYEDVSANNLSVFKNINNKSDGKQAFENHKTNTRLSYARAGNTKGSQIINDIIDRYGFDKNVIDMTYLNKSVNEQLNRGDNVSSISKFIIDYYRESIIDAYKEEAMDRGMDLAMNLFTPSTFVSEAKNIFKRHDNGSFIRDRGRGNQFVGGGYDLYKDVYNTSGQRVGVKANKINQTIDRLDNKAFEKLYGNLDRRPRISSIQNNEKLNKIISKMEDNFVSDGLDISKYTDDDARMNSTLIADSLKAITANTTTDGSSRSLEESIMNMNDTSRLSTMTMISSFQQFTGKLLGKDGELKKSTDDISEKYQEQIKDVLLNEETGLLKDQVKGTKTFGKELLAETKKQLYDKYDFVYDNFMKYKYGDAYRENEEWRNNELSQKMDLKKKYEAKLAAKEVDAKTAEGMSSQNIPTVIAEKEIKAKVDKTTEPVVEKIQSELQATVEATEVLKSSTEALAETVVGDTSESPEKKSSELKSTFVKQLKKMIPKAGIAGAIGAGVGLTSSVGLLGSLVLPGGPVAGAIVGSGLAILSETEAFKTVMFGKADEDGERKGGLISKKLSESFKKSLPAIVTGGVLGGAKSLITGAITGGGGLGVLGMQLLPGGVLGGALLGMGFSLLKENETVKSFLFGKADDNGKRSGTFLSDSFNKAGEGMSKLIPALKGGAKGLGIGALTGGVLSSMGTIPAMLSMGGPIGMGAVGLGLGIASTSGKFNEWMFGTDNVDKDGNVIGKNKDGMLHRFQNIMRVNLIDPIATSFNTNVHKLLDWTKDELMYPFRRAFGPILDSITGIKDNISDYVKAKLDTVTSGLLAVFKSTFKSIFSPFTKILGKVGSGALSLSRLGIQAALTPFSALTRGAEFLTTGKRMKEYGGFYKSYYGDLKGNMSNYFAAKAADGQNMNALDKTGAWLQAITGGGEVADAYRDGYNEQMGADGRNNLNWRTASREQRADKKQRDERLKEEAKWRKIDKLRENITNKDLGGREVTLSDYALRKYQDKFTKLGIDPSMLESSDDIMDLLYRRSDFKKKLKGDTEEAAGMSTADFQTSTYQDESLNKQDQTIEAINNITKVLLEIAKGGSLAAAEKNFEESTAAISSTQLNDRKNLKRRIDALVRKDKDAKDKFNLSDDMNEYDVGGLTNEDLQDYKNSDFYEEGNFEDWLKSKGRRTYDEVENKTEEGISSENNVAAAMKENTKAQQFLASVASGGAITMNNAKNAIKGSSIVSSVQKKIGLNFFSEKDADKDNKELADSIGTKFADVTANDQKAEEEFELEQEEKAKEEAEKELISSEEKAESLAAQALGDKESGGEKDIKARSFLQRFITDPYNDKIKDSKVGAFISNILKGGLGTLAGVAGLGLAAGVIETFRPGTVDQITGAMDTFVQKVDEDPEFIANAILSMFQAGSDKLFNQHDGVLATIVLPEMMNFISSTVPTLITEYIIPGLGSIGSTVGTFIGENAATIAQGFSEVIIKAGPPFIKAVFDVIWPTITGLATGLWDQFTGNTSSETVSPNQEWIYDAQGKNLKDNWKNVTQEEAAMYSAQGYEVVEENGQLKVNDKQYLPGNYYIGSNGETVKGGFLESEGSELIGSIGNRARNIAFTNSSFGTFDKLAVNAAGAGIGAVGGSIKGTAKAIATGKVGPLGIGLMGRSIAGSAKGAWNGAKLTSKIMDPTNAFNSAFNTSRYASSATKLADDAVEVTADALTNEKLLNSVLNTSQNSIDDMFANASADLIAKQNMVDSVLNTSQNSIDDILSSGTKQADEIAGATIDILDDVAENATKVSDTVTKEVAEGSGNMITKFINSAKSTVDDLVNNKTLVAAANLVAGDGNGKSIIKAMSDKILSFIGTVAGKVAKSGDTLVRKAASLITEKSVEVASKTTAGASTAGILTVVFAVHDFATGAFEANNLFRVNDPDLLMISISAVMKTLLGIGPMPLLDLVFEVVEMFTDFDVKHELASAMYILACKLVGNENAVLALTHQQDQLQREVDIYNEINGTNMSLSEYNDAKNKDFWSAVFSGDIFDFARADEDKHSAAFDEAERLAKEEMGESPTYTATAEGLIGSNTSLTSQEANAANPIGYGSGKSGASNNNAYSQANVKWKNMPIGKFDDGTIATMERAGCGPTAMSAVANMMGTDIRPDQMATFASNNGYISQGGANRGLFTMGASQLGLSSNEVNSSTELLSSLSSGKPVIMSGQSSSSSSPYTKAGHIVVGTGLSKNGVNVLDPSTGKSSAYSIDKLTKNITNAWSYKPVGYGDAYNHGFTNSMLVTTSAQDLLGLDDFDRRIQYDADMAYYNDLIGRMQNELVSQVGIRSDEELAGLREAIDIASHLANMSYDEWLEYKGVGKAEAEQLASDYATRKSITDQVYGFNTLNSKLQQDATTSLYSAENPLKTAPLSAETLSQYTLDGETLTPELHSNIIKGVVDYNTENGITRPLTTSDDTTQEIIDLDYLKEKGASGMGFFETITWLGKILGAQINSMINGTDLYEELNNATAAEEESANTYSSSSSMTARLANPRSAAEEILAKAVEVTIGAESGGDYTAVNPKDGGDGVSDEGTAFSVGIHQMHRSNAKNFLTELAENVTDSAKRERLLYYAAQSDRSLTSQEASELESLLGDSEVAPFSEKIQDREMYGHMINTNLHTGSWLYDDGYLNNKRSIILGADINNTGNHLPAWSNKWISKYGNNVLNGGIGESEELSYVKDSLKTDTYWGSTADPSSGQHQWYNGWMNRIDKTYNTLSGWNGKYTPPRTLENDFKEMSQSLGYGEGNTSNDTGDTLSLFNSSMMDILRAGTAGLSGVFGSDVIDLLMSNSDNNSEDTMYNNTLLSTAAPAYSSSNGNVSDYFLKNLSGSTLTSEFGPRIHPIYGTQSHHNGIDYAAPAGTPIPSPVNGTVITNQWNSSYGNWLVIEDDYGGQHTFAHMQSPSPFAVGSRVRAGDIVGYVGTTGDSTGNHLHYGVKYNGAWKNPETHYYNQTPPVGYGSGKQDIPSLSDQYIDDYYKEAEKEFDKTDKDGKGGGAESILAELNDANIVSKLGEISEILVNIYNKDSTSSTQMKSKSSSQTQAKVKRDIAKKQSSSGNSKIDDTLFKKHATNSALID